MSQVRYFWSCDGVCRHWLVCHGGRHSGSVGLEQGEVEAYMRACKLVRMRAGIAPDDSLKVSKN